MIIKQFYPLVLSGLLALCYAAPVTRLNAQVGVGAKPPADAEILFDGSRAMLDEKWTYWAGPRLAATLPVKWAIVADPVDGGTVMNSNDPTAAGGKYGTADIVTKKAYRDFRLHIEFLVANPGGNSGVYLQNRYEIQVLDGDTTKHGMGAVINETASPYYAYNGAGKWNAYDIVFRAARFRDGNRNEKAMLTMFFNGQRVYTNQTINQVWGGANSGIDGGNDGGKGITDTPGGLKLQAEGHNVLYRNIWIKELDLQQPETDLFAQQIPLWPNGAPGFENRRNEPEQAQDWWVKNIQNPSVTVYLPPKEKATGAAVVVCPGGGHRALVYNSEGRDAALFLNSIGVAAFVLKYRLFREENSPYTFETTRQDALRAMRLVRSRAAEWGVDANRVGIMGFSAGGEVVAQVAYAPGAGDPNASDPVDRLNGRPDFQILVYPGPLGVPDELPKDAPPAFMIAAIDDECCSAPILNLLQKYHAAKIPAEAHIYARGSHAFNMGQRSDLITLKTWPQRLADWMADNSILRQ